MPKSPGSLVTLAKNVRPRAIQNCPRNSSYALHSSDSFGWHSDGHFCQSHSRNRVILFQYHAYLDHSVGDSLEGPGSVATVRYLAAEADLLVVTGPVARHKRVAATLEGEFSLIPRPCGNQNWIVGLDKHVRSTDALT